MTLLKSKIPAITRGLLNQIINQIINPKTTNLCIQIQNVTKNINVYNYFYLHSKQYYKFIISLG